MNNNMIAWMASFDVVLLRFTFSHIPYIKYIMDHGVLETMLFPKVSKTSKVGPLTPNNIHNISCFLNKHKTNQYIGFKRLK